jgi:DNA-binding MarR family transcriptional regulator
MTQDTEIRSASGKIGVRIDRDAVHRVIYRRADRHHRFKGKMTDLAEELGVSYFNFTIVIRSMADEGRLRRIGGAANGAKTYLVVDPEEWKPLT